MKHCRLALVLVLAAPSFGLQTFSRIPLSSPAPTELFPTDETVKLIPPGVGFFDSFGLSVALSGSTTVVGAPGDDDNGNNAGSAYLLSSSSGQQLFKLLAADGTVGDAFGASVAASGSLSIIGAPGDDDNGFGSGSAYVFDIVTGQQLAKLLPLDGTDGDNFGSSVAISGPTAIIGASGDGDNGSSSGSAYLFDVVTGQQLAKLLPVDGAAEDRFGHSVAISGATATVGAYLDDDNGHASGSAYLFDVGSGQQFAKLLSSAGAIGDMFGYSVAISGSTAIIGAPGAGLGSAHLFDTLTGQQLMDLHPGCSGGVKHFGTSVAIGTNVAIVGLPADGSSAPFAGSADVFDTLTGERLARLLASDGENGDLCGESVAVDGNTLVVGAPGDDDQGSASGSAYVFEG